MKLPATISVAATAAIMLAACGTGGTARPPSAPEDVSTEITDDPVTLTVSYVSDPPITPLVEGFTEQHPNVTIELRQTPFSDYQTSLRLSLASDDSPDIVQYSPGPMTSIVPAGLVEPLDAYAEAYGWKERVPRPLTDILSSNDDATQNGTGQLYATPGAIQVIGVFYNKNLTADAGVTDEPATLAELEDDFAAVQAGGVTPLTMPALEVSGFQLWGALANVLADVDTFNAWVYGEPNATLESHPGFAQAAAKLKQWVDAGYIADGVAGVADADGIAEFTSGERAYYVTGNWNAQAFTDVLGDDVGFFLLPRTTTDQAPVATTSGFPYSISAKSENKDVAAAFLDYMVSQDAAPDVLESGFVPVTPGPDEPTSGVESSIQASYEDVAAAGGIAPFANWTTSSMVDTLTTGVQSLISGTVSPEEFIASLQADWERNRS